MNRLPLCLILVAALWTVALADEGECTCTQLPTGKYFVEFSETVATGYKKTGTMTMDHLYNEAYYGTVKLPSIVPFTPAFNMDFMGYLNGTSCVFRGSMAFVIIRHTLAFSANYVGDKTLKGHYHRCTAFKVDDHFGGLTMKLISDKAESNELDDEAEFNAIGADYVPDSVQYVV